MHTAQLMTTQPMKTAQPNTTAPQTKAIAAMGVGLVLTIVATIVPFITSALRDHIRAGYPRYTDARVDTAVTHLVDHLDHHRSARRRRLALVNLDRRDAQARGELGCDRDVRPRHRRRRHQSAGQGHLR